ncbi:MAG TPA: hypothetical protein VHV57_12865 [Acidimicrobiales bacterium]|nr:hypothetical protein [Acidimicrobiales bacterium]
MGEGREGEVDVVGTVGRVPEVVLVVRPVVGVVRVVVLGGDAMGATPNAHPAPPDTAGGQLVVVDTSVVLVTAAQLPAKARVRSQPDGDPWWWRGEGGNDAVRDPLPPRLRPAATAAAATRTAASTTQVVRLIRGSARLESGGRRAI